MEVIKYNKNKDWGKILERPAHDASDVEKKVRRILDAVKKNGDKAIKKYSATFDKVTLKAFLVTDKELETSADLLDQQLRDAIGVAKSNIEKFHGAGGLSAEIIQTMPGISCWRKSVAIEKVGLYIPGGSASLFSSLLMLAIPARMAGCREIIVCSPPDKNGKLNPAILYIANLLGIKTVFKIGGAQAIGAMAYGTRQVPQVYKIFGPGNQFVTCAKQLVQKEGVAIDLPAGPSEVAIFADETAEISFVAADLLSQAEHGADSQVILVTTSPHLAAGIKKEIIKQAALLPRKEIAKKALEKSITICVNQDKEAMELLNAYAPEHLILNCKNATELAEKVVNAGSVFLGNYSPESVGDYASGTNHTLPTNGYARSYSGVSLDSFVKKITFQQLSREGLALIGKTVEIMAEAEGLRGHAEAVRIRTGKPGQSE